MSPTTKDGHSIAQGESPSSLFENTTQSDEVHRKLSFGGNLGAMSSDSDDVLLHNDLKERGSSGNRIAV